MGKNRGVEICINLYSIRGDRKQNSDRIGTRGRFPLMRVVRWDRAAEGRDDGVLPSSAYIHVSGSDGVRQICLRDPRKCRGGVVPTTGESPRAAIVPRRGYGDGALATSLGICRSPDTDRHFKEDQRTKLW